MQIIFIISGQAFPALAGSRKACPARQTSLVVN